MPVSEHDRRLVEAAVTGISGAAFFGDLAYARQRHDEVLASLQRLEARGLNVGELRLKAERQLRACGRRDVEGARRLAAEIIRYLSLSS